MPLANIFILRCTIAFKILLYKLICDAGKPASVSSDQFRPLCHRAVNHKFVSGRYHRRSLIHCGPAQNLAIKTSQTIFQLISPYVTGRRNAATIKFRHYRSLYKVSGIHDTFRWDRTDRRRCIRTDRAGICSFLLLINMKYRHGDVGLEFPPFELQGNCPAF